MCYRLSDELREIRGSWNFIILIPHLTLYFPLYACIWLDQTNIISYHVINIFFHLILQDMNKNNRNKQGGGGGRGESKGGFLSFNEDK